MRPKISVVFPTKNEKKVIEKTLKQFLPVKKKFGLEVIVADGGSKDGTIKIARKLADRVIIEKKPKNIASGRNTGCFAAKAPLIFCTDADIRIPNISRFFTRMSEVFEDEEIVAATTKVFIYPKDETFSDKILHGAINLIFKTGTAIGIPRAKGESQLLRASAFRKIGGYNEKLNVAEDLDLFKRLGKVGKVRFVKDLVLHHSPRRYRQVGYLRLFLFHWREVFSLIFRNKSYLKKWKEVR